MRFGVFGIIAVAFLALEMVVMYLIAGEIGTGRTVLWLLADMIAGMMVIRHAGAGFLPALQAALHGGHAPFAVVWATGRRFLAGALLILPGFVSDLVALPLLLWPAPRLPAAPRPRGPGPDDVIEGEFRREDPAPPDERLPGS